MYNTVSLPAVGVGGVAVGPLVAGARVRVRGGRGGGGPPARRAVRAAHGAHAHRTPPHTGTVLYEHIIGQGKHRCESCSLNVFYSRNNRKPSIKYCF